MVEKYIDMFSFKTLKEIDSLKYPAYIEYNIENTLSTRTGII